MPPTTEQELDNLVNIAIVQARNHYNSQVRILEQSRARRALLDPTANHDESLSFRYLIDEHPRPAYVVQNMDPDSIYNTITQSRRAQNREVPRALGAQAHTHRQNAPRSRSPTRPTLTDQQLVMLRQARHLSGLDCRALDEEIARRVIADPQAWGWVGREMVARGWATNNPRST